MADLPDLSIRQLEYLVAVDESPTWAVAAERVGVSASALSQGLAELERRVGVSLFEREGRRRVIRVAARPVLDHARQVVALTGDLVDWSDRMRTARAGRVAVGMIDVAAVEHFPEQLRSFRAERPDVELTLNVAPSARLLDELRAGRLDLAVCVAPPSPVPEIAFDELFDEPIVVYGPAGSRAARPQDWGPWVLFPGGSHTRHQVVERLRQLGASLQVAAESHQPDVILEMVALGLGWTALPSSVDADERLTRGAVLLERQLVLARRRGAVSDPAADDLAKRIRSHRPVAQTYAGSTKR